MAPSREAIGAITIAVLAVLGVGLIAATLTTTYAVGLDGSGLSDGGGSGVHEGPSDGSAPDTDPPGQADHPPGETQSGPIEFPKVCVPILTKPGIIVGIIAAFALIVAVSYRQFELLGAAFTVYLVGVPTTLAYGLLTQCATAPGRGVIDVLGEGVVPQPGSGVPAATPVPPALLVALFVLAAIGAVVMVLTGGNSETIEPAEPVAGADEDLDLLRFARTAGSAADRIEASQASVDNAVYRAWREVTDLLDESATRSMTQREFATTARAAGLDSGHVEDLTRLFEEVRYGDMDPEPREELAVKTLRAIEAAYDPSNGEY